MQRIPTPRPNILRFVLAAERVEALNGEHKGSHSANWPRIGGWILCSDPPKSPVTFCTWLLETQKFRQAPALHV